MFIIVLFPFISAECSEADEGAAALHDQTGMPLLTAPSLIKAHCNYIYILDTNFRKVVELREAMLPMILPPSYHWNASLQSFF